MSDLQFSLLAAGAVIVIGVYLFNGWQARQLRRRVEQAFAREHDDVLLQDPQARAEAPAKRLEPSLQSAISPESALNTPTAMAVTATAACGVDSVIDYVVAVANPSAADGADLLEELRLLTAQWEKPVRAAGCNPAGGEWREIGTGGGIGFLQLHFALQMSNRSGCVEPDQLGAFCDAVLRWTERNQGDAKCPDIGEAHARAVQLDRFCAEVDIAIGINVVAAAGNAFSGARILALAEASGFSLEADGMYRARGEHGELKFALDNHEPTPFSAAPMKSLTTRGITFLLDVPRVTDAPRVFDDMLDTARNFAAALDGTLVDDNRAILSGPAIATIRQQLRGIVAKMEAAQIAAGEARALRLFS